MLAAIADAPRTPALWPLLRRLAQPRGSAMKTELLAGAAARQGDSLLIAPLVSLLSVREGREAVRAALVALGDAALDEVTRTMRDPSSERRLRLHMPKTLARFANRQAAERLLEGIERDPDSLVRYKSIRALRLLVTENRIPVDRVRMERLCHADLEKHFQAIGLRVALETATTEGGATRALVLEFLKERAANALERAFQELQIAHPRQGVHHAYLAWRSGDPYVRANATELLEALLPHADQKKLRELFHLATDDLPLVQRAERARPLVPKMVRTPDEAIDALVHAHNAMLAALGRRLRAQRRTPLHISPLPLAAAR
jgi:HEAT repeat protein